MIDARQRGGGLRVILLLAALRGACVIGLEAASNRAASDALFEESVVRTIRMEVSPTALQSFRRDSREYVRATVREGDEVFLDVGVHLKGMGSFRPVQEKPSFSLKFDEFRPGQSFHGLNKILLNNSVQDRSYLCEYLATRLFREAGVPAARVTHIRVFLNDRDLGLYLLLEGMNKRFLKRNFGNAEGNLYEAYLGDINENMDQDSGADRTQRDVRELFSVTQIANLHTRWSRLEKVLDVKRFVDFVAMEMLLSHWDGYALHTNNYRIYRDPRNNRMIFIAHGLDSVLKRPAISIRPPVRSVVGRAVLETREGQALYRERVGELFTNVFRVPVMTNRINAVLQKLRSAGLSGEELADIQKKAEALRLRVEMRAESVSNQLAGVSPEPLRFHNGVATLSGWREEQDTGNPRMNVTKGSLHLKIAANEECVASWRTSVFLKAGRYRFEGRVATSNLVSRPGRGATLRISGDQRVSALSGSNGWQPMAHDFRTQEDTDVELVCEVRASAGEAWFEFGSLRLVQPGPRTSATAPTASGVSQ